LNDPIEIHVVRGVKIVTDEDHVSRLTTGVPDSLAISLLRAQEDEVSHDATSSWLVPFATGWFARRTTCACPCTRNYYRPTRRSPQTGEVART
jgi:hypothetical protein